MMLPSAQIMATGAQGDSAHLLAMRGQQAGNTAAALEVPMQAQAVVGMAGQGRELLQGARTEQHGMQTVALNSTAAQPISPQQFVAQARHQIHVNDPRINGDKMAVLAAMMQQQGMLG